jgi:hypothetical protein
VGVLAGVLADVLAGVLADVLADVLAGVLVRGGGGRDARAEPLKRLGNRTNSMLLSYRLQPACAAYHRALGAHSMVTKEQNVYLPGRLGFWNRENMACTADWTG